MHTRYIQMFYSTYASTLSNPQDIILLLISSIFKPSVSVKCHFPTIPVAYPFFRNTCAILPCEQSLPSFISSISSSLVFGRIALAGLVPCRHEVSRNNDDRVGYRPVIVEYREVPHLGELVYALLSSYHYF